MLYSFNVDSFKKKANISVLECSNKNVLSVGYIYKAVSWLDTVTIISMLSITIDNTLWWFTFQQVNNPSIHSLKVYKKQIFQSLK